MNLTETWIFTFGFGQTHPDTGEPLKNCYVAIKGDVTSSRERMVARFGQKWSMQYRSKEDAGVERYNLREIPLYN
jgi:hypothetical protein